MKKILIFVLVALLLALSVYSLFETIRDIKLFCRYVIPNESAASIQSNWNILYRSIAYLALSICGIAFSAVFFIKAFLKRKAK